MATVSEALTIATQYYQSGQGQIAEQVCRQILDAVPEQPDALHLLGLVYAQAGRLDVAVEYVQRAVELAPEFAVALSNLGAMLKNLERFDEAIAALRRSLELMPANAMTLNNLGATFNDMGRPDEAEPCLRRALELDPNIVEVHSNLAYSWLVQGNLEQGWPEFEWRWRKKLARPTFPQPQWDGSPLDGKTILLLAEQGFGDTLQFVRYAPLVRQRGGRVIVECLAPLVRLVASCPGVEQVIPKGCPLPPFDVYAPMMSLPGIVGTNSLDQIPADVPYLDSGPELVQRWRTRLSAVPGFRVGICWQGDPTHRRDRFRSVPLSQFAPLAAVPGVTLVSLQKGRGREQLAQSPDLAVDVWTGLSDLETDLADAAAIVRCLDLVITVDSAVAHLAGAVGVPVWVAMMWAPDWRWLMNREDSPWYPKMRLFRQGHDGNWGEVFARMAVTLNSVSARL